MKYLKRFESFSINEGVIRLLPDEKKQLSEITSKIEKIILSNDYSKANVIVKGPEGSEDDIEGINSIEVGEFRYLFADKKEGKLKVYVSDCKTVPDKLRDQLGFAWYRPNVPENLEDGQIVINASEFQANLKGEYEEGHKEKLRSVLTHEIIHAKDPNFNHLKGKGDNTKDYTTRDEEIKAFTAQFIDLIENKVERWIQLNSDKEGGDKQNEIDMIGQILNNFLLIFSRTIHGGSLNVNISDFIEDFKLNINNLNRRLKFGTDEFETFTQIYGSKILTSIFSRLIEISQKEPRRYNKFLTSLYKSIKDLFDKVNQSIKNTDYKPIKITTASDKVGYSW